MAQYLRTSSLLCALLVSSCAHAPATGGGAAPAQIDVGRGDPPTEMTELGAFMATDPPTCIGDGRPGTEEGALSDLRARAAALGADYVQIFRADKDSCDRIVIRAMAFKRAPG